VAAPRRLARTLSGARWEEYRELLEAALAGGYAVVSLERWVRGKPADDEHALILRHDVDQHPRSAVEMAAVEEDVGVSSTWYFRWRTARLPVIQGLRERGASVGLHYETLTRFALDSGITVPIEAGPVVEECRAALRSEISSFAELFGPVRSVAAHGDSRVPAVRNAVLLEGQDPASFGVEFDANLALAQRRVSSWSTDRAAPEAWAPGAQPVQLIQRGVSPILCLTHPNNWASGPSLWADRAAAALLPAQGATGGSWLRTGRDAPPV